MTRRLLPLVAVAVVLALSCAAGPALAAPPWAAPQPLVGVGGGALPVAMTPAGNGVVLAGSAQGAPGQAAAALVRVAGDGTQRGTQTLPIGGGLVATTGSDGVVVAGSTLVGGTVTDASRVTVATGTAAGGVGAPRGVPGTTGQHVFDVAGNARGDVALVTGSEGESNAPAEVRFATAAPGRGWGPARLIDAAGVAGAGRYVADPAVRLVADGDERALLAWTGYADGHSVVRATEIVAGHRQPAQTLTPAGQDAVLAAADVVAGGPAAILARTGVAGADAVAQLAVR